jgi:hypothetical protein
LASFWLTKGEFHRSQFMRFLCYATQESKAEECKGQTSMFSPRQVVRHSFFSFPITCDGRSHIFLASFSLSFVKEHVLLIFLRCNRRSIPSFFKKKSVLGTFSHRSQTVLNILSLYINLKSLFDTCAVSTFILNAYINF